MRSAALLCVLGAVSMITGCAGPETCEEPEFYESAVEGKRIDAPEDLSELAAYKEMVIPEASPRQPREPGECLDRPPTLRVE